MPRKSIPTEGPWYRQRWPWLVMLGPFLVVLAGSYTGWLAFTRQDALVVGDYYQRGQAINQDLRRDDRASALGLNATLRYDAAHALLSGTIHGLGHGHGQAAPGPLLLHLAHATMPKKDIKLEVQPDAAGAFSVALPMLERTRWQVLVENAQRDWRLEGSWSWPAQSGIGLQADMAKLAQAR